MALIRVLEMPQPLPLHHFGGGEEVRFNEVDWFRDDSMSALSPEEWRAELTKFVQEKRYYSPTKAYLLLDGAGRTFTLNYEAP
jgi:hypothetical protein